LFHAGRASNRPRSEQALDPVVELDHSSIASLVVEAKILETGVAPVPWRRQITIAQVIARLNVGGAATQAIAVTAALRARGYKTLLLTGSLPLGEASLEDLAAARSVGFVRIASMSRRISVGKDVLSLVKLVRVLRRQRTTVIHTHTAKAGFVGRLAAMILRVPVRVHTFHGHVFHGYFSRPVTWALLLIERFLARHTDCIVAISESQRRDLSEVYRVAPAARIRVIPLGVDLNPFLQSCSARSTQDGGDTSPAPVIGWVGRLTAIKDPLLLLHCVPLVTRAAARARFVVVGDGELRGTCENLIRRQRLEQQVTLLGWRRDLPELYPGFDLVALTSINEGTPVALMEAMASGKAIVSTDVGGVRDLMAGHSRRLGGLELFDNGILVRREAALIAAAIGYLLRHPEQRRAMGAAGRAFIRSRFSCARLADELEALYISLARAKGLLPVTGAGLACAGAVASPAAQVHP
jgi:glycosyltransferase involved in cell wall biosynthesis